MIQIRNASRKVSVYIGRAWRRRHDRDEFVRALSKAEGEVTAVEVYTEIACRCNYIEDSDLERICREYESILGQLAVLVDTANDWAGKSPHDHMPFAASGLREES